MRKYCFQVILIFISAIGYIYSQPVVRFAAIGDYGRWYTPGERLVSGMIHNWDPDFIITLGDNNYEYGADSTIDSNIGQFYHDFIFPYTGIFGTGAQFNKFFPSMGNHDWLTDSARPYIDYFQLPGNERYYDFVKGNIHFFVVNSDINEPDGITTGSPQAHWLMNKLSQSVSRFKIVYFHHPPYSSGQHGNNLDMRWPFKQWGANAVFCGHEHNYERLVDSTGLTYFVNGLGGKDWREFGTVVPESRYRFTGNYGALFVTSYTDSLNIKFIAYPDSVKDDTTIILSPIGIVSQSEIADDFILYQNYPNPFNPVTNIRFSITESGLISLKIYDVSGKFAGTLTNNFLQPGNYEIQWDASLYPSGIYYYELTSVKGKISKKMVLIK
ncbi:MAG: metallophosphoesterase [Ignavibacteria bacterium]|nr:metallophosphoesterase [Ignavibacteria bacterium]